MVNFLHLTLRLYLYIDLFTYKIVDVVLFLLLLVDDYSQYYVRVELFPFGHYSCDYIIISTSLHISTYMWEKEKAETCYLNHHYEQMFWACWSLSSSALIFLMAVWERGMLERIGNKEIERMQKGEREKVINNNDG